MIDIREHGGNFGGSSFKPIGNEVVVKANEQIKKGEFVGVVNTSNNPVPTVSVVQSARAFVTENTSMDYSFMHQLTSDAGNSIVIRGRSATSDAYIRVSKPYTNKSGILSIETSAMNFEGLIYSYTKLNSNTFAMFIANSSGSTTGVRMVVIRISDETGEPSLVSNTLISSDYYFKSFVYIPMTDDGLSGIVLYARGNYSYGYSDNAFAYFNVLTMSASFTNPSLLLTTNSSANQIYSKGSVPYPSFNNINYSDDSNKVFFGSERSEYSLTWGGKSSIPILTTINGNFNSSSAQIGDRTIMRFNRKSTSYSLDNDGRLIQSTWNKATNAVTNTLLYANTSNIRNVLVTLPNVIDRNFLLKNIDTLNPQVKKMFKPIGGNAFITVAGNNGNSSYSVTALLPVIYYFNDDLSNLSKIAVGNALTSVSDSLDSGIYVDINKDLNASLFWTSYSYYEGSGSYRSKLSGIYKFAMPFEVKVSKFMIFH